MRSVEIDRGGAADHDVDRAGTVAGPPARGDSRTDGLLLGRTENIGDVEVTGYLDIHAGRHIGLRIEIHDECSHSTGEGSRSQTKGHRGLADAAFEGTYAEYVHE